MPEQPWQRTQKIQLIRPVGYDWYRPLRKPRAVPLNRLRPGDCFMLLPPKREGAKPWAIVIGRDISGAITTSPVEIVRDESGMWKRRDRRRP